MAEKIILVGASEPIPTGTWRYGVFWLNPEVMKNFSDEEKQKYITTQISRAGLRVSYYNLDKLNLAVTLKGATGPVTGEVYGTWVENYTHGLTPAMVFQRTKIPSVFFQKAAPHEVEQILDGFLTAQPIGGVVELTPIVWSTPESYLNTDSWYTGVAAWTKSVPSFTQLEERLQAKNYNLWSVKDSVKPYYVAGEPKGLSFIFYSGQTATTVDEVRQAIGATTLVVNLGVPMDEPQMKYVDRINELGDSFLQTAGEASEKMANGLKQAAEGGGAAISAVTKFIGYLPYILLVGGISYVGYRIYKAKNRGGA